MGPNLIRIITKNQLSYICSKITKTKKYKFCIYKGHDLNFNSEMRREGSWKKFPMCSASMSREPIRAYLRLYLENRRKIRFMKQRFEIQYIILQSVARNTFAVSIRTRAAL